MIDLRRFDGHTLGPWMAFARQDGSAVIRTAPHDLGMPCEDICSLGDPEGWHPGRYKANAWLLEAAPDLLAEVRALRAERDDYEAALLKAAHLIALLSNVPISPEETDTLKILQQVADHEESGAPNA